MLLLLGLLVASFFLRVLVVLVVGVKQLVPPGEGRSVVAHKVHVMEVVEAGAGVERQQVQRVDRDVVPAGGWHNNFDVHLGVFFAFA